MSEAFGPEHRIQKASEFKAVIKNGQKISGTTLFFWSLEKSKEQPPKLGLIVSARSAPQAVTRNRWKRLLREAFRKRKGKMGSVYLIAKLKEGRGSPERKAIENDFDRLVRHLERKP